MKNWTAVYKDSNMAGNEQKYQIYAITETDDGTRTVYPTEEIPAHGHPMVLKMDYARKHQIPVRFVRLDNGCEE